MVKMLKTKLSVLTSVLSSHTGQYRNIAFCVHWLIAFVTWIKYQMKMKILYNCKFIQTELIAVGGNYWFSYFRLFFFSFVRCVVMLWLFDKLTNFKRHNNRKLSEKDWDFLCKTHYLQAWYVRLQCQYWMISIYMSAQNRRCWKCPVNLGN